MYINTYLFNYLFNDFYDRGEQDRVHIIIYI